MISGVVYYSTRIIFADTMKLQEMLNVVQDYVVKWKSSFNGKKSKVNCCGIGWKSFEVDY